VAAVSQVGELAGVVLAAGAGTRLRPLTAVRPKALCTVAGRTLLDGALARLAPHVARSAVNAHHHADQVVAALAGRDVHVEVERPVALGTAGALGNLRGWLAGAAVLLTNADACHPGDDDPLGVLLDGWDGERPRLLCARTGVRQDFGDLQYVGSAALPWWSVRELPATPAGLYEVSWRQLYADGGLDVIETPGPAVDCGTPVDYLRANMLASGGRPVVEPGAVVAGELVRSVVWSGETVAAGERLVDAIRGAGVTLQPLANGSPTRSPGE
jgi:N-acetyl-alpha-D-muramate 1-phosphate uridylyltransferase